MKPKAITPESVITHFKGIRETAEALGITTATVYNWMRDGKVPYQSQILIELRTDGKYQAKREKK